MTEVEGSFTVAKIERNVRFLLCDNTPNAGVRSGRGEWVRSPIECLEKAMNGDAGIVVIRFPEVPVWAREALMVLCAALKRNRQTKEIPILALLPTEHRKLTEDLHRAGVDFIKTAAEGSLSSSALLEMISGLSEDDRVERHLATVCPFLHYTMIDPHQEMTVCGAYLDRMVLGGRRLREVCKTQSHLQCEYFRKPRRKA